MLLAAVLAAASIVTPAAGRAAGSGFPALLMSRGIEAFSNASSSGDQATLDRLTDDDVLFSGGDGLVQRDAKRDRHDAISAVLKWQTQLFRAAVAHGDSGVANRVLDPHLIAVDENGTVLSRAAFDAAIRGRVTPPVAFDGWTVHHDANVAVTSYTLQIGNRRSLAVDSWIRRGYAWTVIATQAIPLHADPPGISLTAAALDAYAGTYAVAPQLIVTIARAGATLTSSLNGARPVALIALGNDAFQTGGSPAGAPPPRIIFHRDASGAVTGYTNRLGLVLTKAAVPSPDPAASAQGVTSTVLPATKLQVYRFGTVAVATFIHQRVTNEYGQTLHQNFRSTETWIERGSTWKMLALQSRELD